MSKNFAAIYNSGNDSVGLNQTVFIKEEASRGVLLPPTGADHIKVLGGGTSTFNRPIFSSPIRSGRHNQDVVEEKDVTSWSLPMYYMIDESLGAWSTALIDPALRVLKKSQLGREVVNASDLTYDSADAPDLTFSIFENGDQWSNQVPGAFVMDAVDDFPGNGQAQQTYSGRAKTLYKIGIGKSTTDNNAGNTVTLQAGEGERMEVGGYVMIIESDGVTRSADTPDGSPRLIQSIAGDVITLDGAVLADADGAASDIYLAYYEPETPVAINNPLTGLVGSIDIAGLTQECVRSMSINSANNHEVQDFCWGERGLAGPLFTPADRLNVEVSVELNLNHKLLEFIKGLKQFTGENITLTLGEAAGRRMRVLIPKVIFPVPEIPIPDTGTIPVTFTGMAYQTGDDTADEIKYIFE